MGQIKNAPVLLVAAPDLTDANFKKTVILLMDHNDSGALGFIINRKSETPVTDILLDQSIRDLPGQQAWFGGPIDAETAIILKPEGSKDQSSISITSSKKALEDYIQYAQSQSPQTDWLYPYRFLVGYAGWAPQQLDEEIRIGAWISIPCDHNLLFNCHWQHIWQQSLLNLGIRPGSMVTNVSQSFLN